MQVYDGPGFPVVHADFYRLRGADELAQLGWDEAIEGAVTLVEWPERAGEALPRRPARHRARFDPAHGPDFRRAEMRAFGALGGRADARARAIEALLRARRLGRGASASRCRATPRSRAYERLTRRDGRDRDPDDLAAAARTARSCATASPMRRSPSCRPTSAPSSRMAEGLRALGYSTPRIFAHSVADGLALIEDFGAETIADERGPNPARYAEATALLADLHARELPSELPVDGETYALPTYDIDAMLIEVELALDWYAPAVARVDAALRRAHAVPRAVARGPRADPRAADDLDAARLSLAQPALARRTRGARSGSA